MKKFTILMFFLIVTSTSGLEKDLVTGKILDSLKVNSTVDETFAIYLPNSYTKSTNSSIIFVFDPSGNGKRGVEVFKKTAEKFNYILVCSNDAKNGPYEHNFEVTNRLFEHIFSEFNIDANRIYTAGFSGGSRLACTIAVLTGSIQGVIGCGAGFAMDLDKKPNFESTFDYVGLVGDEDMNYQEMKSAKNWLDRVKVSNALFTNEEEHKWPNDDQINRALTWLEIQAFKKGLKPTDMNVVKRAYLQDYADANQFEKSNNLNNAKNDYNRIISSYASFFNVDSIRDKINGINTSKRFQEEQKDIQQIEAKEHRLSEEFLEKYRMESILGETPDNFNWWKKEIGLLKKDVEANPKTSTAKMYKRLNYRLFAMAIENSNTFKRREHWASAIYCDKLLVLLNPEQPYWYYRLAESYANKDRFNAVLKNLKEAVNLGFTRTDLISSNQAFQKYRSKKKFNNFLESLDN